MESTAAGTQPGKTVFNAASDDTVLTSRVRLLGCCILVVFGLIEAVYCRHTMQSDGISYLDMGDAILRGDWTMAANAYWSPLYPFLQGLALRLVRPSAYWEFTAVHLLNFLIYLFALGCFDYLLRASVAIQPSADRDNAIAPLPQWSVFALGYAVFLWSSLTLITMERVTPDMLMAGFVYLAVALLLKIWQQPSKLWRFALIGAALGFGYLAKAPVFPLSLVFFAFLWIVAGNWRRAVPGVLSAVLTFALVAGPFVMAISGAKGRFTFGDTGKINYVLLVNGAGPAWYFQNLGTAGGHYKHPVRKVFDAPPIYEFATPIKGTLPIWYDPSYWADGAVPKVHLKKEVSLIIRHVGLYLEMIFTSQAALFVGFVVLCFWSRGSVFLRQIAARWPVWLMGLAGLGMYSLIDVEPRYIGVFFALCWVGLFSGLSIPSGDKLYAVSVITLAVVIAIVTPVAISTGEHLIQALRREPHNQWQVAEDLRRLGVKPGDRVGRIGGRYGTDWARLLGVMVVAEVPRANARDFWNAEPEVQARVIEAFRRLGVTALVAEQIPADGVFTPGTDWIKLGDGAFHALRVPENAEK